MTHLFHPTVLREYDIRGIIGETLGSEDARAIGRAYATLLRADGGTRVAVGYDGRLSSPDLAKALQGEVSGRVWLDGDGHLRLTAAAPVQRLKLVLGAVLLNGDGAVIEDAIRSTQLDIAKAFAGALAITVLLSLYLAGAIGRPIRRLAMSSCPAG